MLMILSNVHIITLTFTYNVYEIDDKLCFLYSNYVVSLVQEVAKSHCEFLQH